MFYTLNYLNKPDFIIPNPAKSGSGRTGKK